VPRPKKKDPREWTTEEAMERLFPKKVRDHVKKETESAVKSLVKRVRRSITD
jgi:hypothetical protein